MDSWWDRLRRAAKWLYPGLGVKRWFLVVLSGLLVLLAGLLFLWTQGIFFKRKLSLVLEFLSAFSPHPLWSVLMLIAGLLLLFWGLQQMGNAIGNVLLPDQGRHLVERLYSRSYLEKGPKIVAIGGGTGLSVLLRGLKEYTANITAIVTVTDDGGSSGRLRNEMGILPPGDIRNCILALADTEPLLKRLFQYRFKGHESLKGHSFGNLFIAAMTEITGFNIAVQEFGKVLAIRGRVLPATLEQIRLKARFVDGSDAEGETNIVDQRKPIEHISLIPANCAPLPEVINAIREADAVILGPGSLYTSIIPNLLLSGIAEAIRESDAYCLYVCNIMTQPGETEGFSASDHLEALRKHGCADIIDGIVINNAKHLPPKLFEKYKKEGSHMVKADRPALAQWNMKIIEAPLLELDELARYAQHDSKKLATLILKTLVEWETGLEGLLAYTFISMNANFRRAKKEMGLKKA
ncbi:MAG: YvcK family protein [Firmicutes bacterium]|nr:YvcK family protein [Bacillota bacterium]